MDSVTWILLGCLAGLAATSLCIACVRRYELAIALVALSPWVSAVFVPNTMELAQFEESTIGSYLRVGILLVAGVAGGMRFLHALRVGSTDFPAHLKLLAVYSALALTSSFYSIDLRFSLIRSVSFATFFSFLAGLHAWLSDEGRRTRLFNALALAVGVCLAINLLSTFFAPGKAWSVEAGNRFQGLWGHPNSMGAFCMVAYLLLYWKMANTASRLTGWALAGLTAWAVVMHTLTGSRTSMITAFFGLMVWCAVQRKPIRLMALSAVAALGVLLIAIFQPPNLYREVDRGMAGLTGRPEIWAAAFTMAAERPFQGFGYEVGGKIFEDPRFQNRELGLWVGRARVSLHNGYLSALVGLGVPGFLALYAALLLPFWRCRSAPADPCKPLLFSVLAMCLTANITESLIGSPAAITSVVLWLLWVVAGRLAPRRIHAGDETAVDRHPVFVRTRE